MKYLLFFTIAFTTPLFLKSSPHDKNDKNPLTCLWIVEKGESYFQCNSGKKYPDEEAINKDFNSKKYTSLRVRVDDDVGFSTGLPIDINSLINSFLGDVNHYRKQHGAKDLTIDKNLQKTAQQKANEAAAKYPTIPNTSNTNSESITCVNKEALMDLMNAWYQKRSSNDFTRMFSEESTSVGFGIEHNGPNYCVVALYSP